MVDDVASIDILSEREETHSRASVKRQRWSPGEGCQDETESEIKDEARLKDDIEALRPPQPPPRRCPPVRHGLLPVRDDGVGGAVALRLVGVVGGVLRRVRPDAEEQVSQSNRIKVRIHAKLRGDRHFEECETSVCHAA